MARPDVLREYRMELSCALSDPEKLAKGMALALKLGERDALEEEKSIALLDYRARSAALDEELASLGYQLRFGAEMREVGVADMAQVATNSVVTIRLDTMEVVETRAMHPNEAQRPLFDDAQVVPEAASEEAEGGVQ